MLRSNELMKAHVIFTFKFEYEKLLQLREKKMSATNAVT